MQEMESMRPQFNENQNQAILKAVSRKVAMTVCRLADEITSEQLLDTADFPVYGVFVSLKRFGQLRACCGTLGTNIPLRDALDHAAYRAAVDDLRFPAITTHEVRELDVEVWILTCPEKIEASGMDRAHYVEIGKHGLQVITDVRRGLLLPGVATELNLDAVHFLEATCQKAGLPKNAWLDDKTAVFRFEGTSIPGKMKDLLDETIPVELPTAPLGPGRRDLAQLADHVHRNIGKFQTQAIPDIYLPGAYDGTVNGASVRMKMRNMYIDCSHIALDAPVPLQSTLLDLARNAADALKQNGFQSLNGITTGVTVFWNASLLGTADVCDTGNVNTKEYGLIVLNRGYWTLAYNPSRTPELLLEDALDRSMFERDPQTKVYAVNVCTSDFSVLISTVQQPMNNVKVRTPVAAGSFYPNTPEHMEKELSRMLAEVPDSKIEDLSRVVLKVKDREITLSEAMRNGGTFSIDKDGNITQSPTLNTSAASPETEEELAQKAAIKAAEEEDALLRQPWEEKYNIGPKKPYSGALIPHAGWVYSGRLAAQTLAQIEIPKTVILFGPKHNPIGPDWAVAPYERWQLPVRNVEGDPLMARLLSETAPEFKLDAISHQREYSIEVNLPILAYLAPGSRVVGAVMAGGSFSKLESAAKKLAAWIAKMPVRPLLVASSDMNHFATDAETRKVDRPAVEALMACDPQRVYNCVCENREVKIRENHGGMCGVEPTVLVMLILRELGSLQRAGCVGYSTSGNISGDKRRVVGYCGMLFE